jgi:hypothetical protein
MSAEDKNKDLIIEALPEEVARELDMYQDYLRYTPVEEIARKYGMSPEGVYKVSQRNEWKAKRAKAKEQAYKNLDKKYRQQLVDIVKFIEHDYRLLMQKCLREGREMSKEERQYVLKLLENLTKENRLNEGRPTDITDNSGIIRHEILLPKGVRRFGVIPPPPNVVQVEASKQDEDKDPDETA